MCIPFSWQTLLDQIVHLPGSMEKEKINIVTEYPRNTCTYVCLTLLLTCLDPSVGVGGWHRGWFCMIQKPGFVWAWQLQILSQPVKSCSANGLLTQMYFAIAPIFVGTFQSESKKYTLYPERAGLEQELLPLLINWAHNGHVFIGLALMFTG